MTALFPCLVNKLRQRVAGLSQIYGSKTTDARFTETIGK